ncbi:MAG: Trk family potassium uptake protein [Ruminococcus sp.]|nr:Trk family potassium uptake protein [Ruminococcus sp.]
MGGDFTKNPIKKLTSFQTIILGFVGIIIAGALLLMLPFASRGEGCADFEDALFTATSAACVTGLITQDTATYWTGFGQAVILILIQTGGFGVVTVASAMTMIAGRKIGLMQRSTMQDSISAPQVGGIVRLTSFAIKITLAVELAGCLLMLPSFIREFGIGKGIWYSVFHSVSAFCNAGFDLMGVKQRFSSLTLFADDILINIVIMLLIIIGGLGFLTWEDIKTHKFKFKKYRMQSKVILSVSLIITVFPAVYYFFEFADWDMPAGKRIITALFQAVTPRTAGFNTVDLSLLNGGGTIIMIVLMLIGGSPGSTAGGMKTTTIAVLFSAAVSVFRKERSAKFFGRRISDDTVKTAAAVLLMYVTIFLTGAVMISSIENVPIRSCLFETSSAIATVGLSLGLTPTLGTVSHILLIIMMFLGRVGGLTVIYAALSNNHVNVSRLPEEKITVG